jgi:HNH endonuclease
VSRPKVKQTVSEGFWRHVDAAAPDECWIWKGYRRFGYGMFTASGRSHLMSHRISWELHRGPIPPGMGVLHRCDNPACVNPAHLFLGTQKDNMRDCKKKGRTAHGERQGRAKLTASNVAQIRRMRQSGEACAEIGKRFNVHPDHVTRIANGRQWRHLQ